MAYNKQEIFNKAKEVIETQRPIFIEELVSYLPCDKTTFYRLFEKESNEYNVLKEMINKGKDAVKSSLRSKWYKSNNVTAQITLYKLLANKEEREAISMQQVNSSNDTTIKVIKVDE